MSTVDTTEESAKSPQSASVQEASGQHNPLDLMPTEAAARTGYFARGLVARASDLVYTYLLEPLVVSRNPPWFDARGVALGLFIGFGIPMGGHTIALGLLRLVIRFNVVLGISIAVVVNPLTIVPLYYGYYCLGSFLLDSPAALDSELFGQLMTPILHESHFWAATRAFVHLGADILTRWVLAAALVATTLGTAGYILAEKVQRNRCRKVAENLGIGYHEYLVLLERNFQQEAAGTVASPIGTESTK